jgi:hypothetical protein
VVERLKADGGRLKQTKEEGVILPFRDVGSTSQERFAAPLQVSGKNPTKI